jgi:hypothetical protein
MAREIGGLALVQRFVLSCVVVAQTAPAAKDWESVVQFLKRSGIFGPMKRR